MTSPYAAPGHSFSAGIGLASGMFSELRADMVRYTHPRVLLLRRRGCISETRALTSATARVGTIWHFVIADDQRVRPLQARRDMRVLRVVHVRDVVVVVGDGGLGQVGGGSFGEIAEVDALIREGKLTPASNPGGMAAPLAITTVPASGATDTAEVVSELREDRLRSTGRGKPSCSRWGPRKLADLAAWFNHTVVLSYDEAVATTWGTLQARAQRRGRPRPANDTWGVERASRAPLVRVAFDEDGPGQ